MSMDLTALRDIAAIGHSGSTSAAIWLSDVPASQRTVAFASLFDLARMRFGVSCVEICDACNTVNLGSAHFCKGCAHKLPAYYASAEANSELAGLEAPAPLTRHASERVHRPSLMDFTAFALVINLLVVIAEFMPVQ